MATENYFLLHKALCDKQFIYLKLIEASELDWQVCFAVSSRIPSYSEYNPRNLHTQNYHEIIVHFSSGRKFISQDKLFSAGRDELIIFPAETAHMGINVSTIPYHRSYLFINPKLFEYLPDGERLTELFHPDSPPLRSFPSELKSSLIPRVAQITSPPELDTLGVMRLRCLIHELFGELAYSSYAVPLDNTMPKLLSDALECINRDFAMLSGSSEIAARLGVSDSYLSRMFNEHLHTSPYRYLRSIRLIEAKRILTGGASVTDACFGAGFGDLSHFISYFKKETGVTPSEWKRDTAYR